MKCSALIFDLDGTLLDTLDDLHTALNHALERQGHHPITRADCCAYVGNGAEALVRRALPPLHQTPAEIAATRKVFAAEYTQGWARATRPYPGIPAMIAEATARRIPLAVLSNKPQTFTQAMVHHFFGPEPFTEVWGERDTFPRKPDPTAALEILRRLDAEPATAVLVGDSPVDVETALAAGITPIAVTWGFRTIEQLRAAGATRFIQHPRELFPTAFRLASRASRTRLSADSQRTG